jgi:hypothetical protein
MNIMLCWLIETSIFNKFIKKKGMQFDRELCSLLNDTSGLMYLFERWRTTDCTPDAVELMVMVFTDTTN